MATIIMFGLVCFYEFGNTLWQYIISLDIGGCIGVTSVYLKVYQHLIGVSQLLVKYFGPNSLEFGHRSVPENAFCKHFNMTFAIH